MLDDAQLFPRPHAHAADHLLVAAPAGVELASDILSDNLPKLPLVRRAGFLVNAGDDGEGVRLPFLLDLAGVPPRSD